MRIPFFRTRGDAATEPTTRRRRRADGQVLVVFAAASLVFIGMCAVVIDVAWYWTSNLRVQRAADAAALAGAVFLPADPTTAVQRSLDEAEKNGYVPGNGTTIIAVPDSANPRQMDVTIMTPVNTFFVRALGIQSFPAKRVAKAEYVLPVPMGSPENYYGNFGLTRGLTSTATTSTTTHAITTGDTGWGDVATAAPTGSWTANSGTLITAVSAADANYARTSTNNATHQWSTFNFITGATPQIPAPAANQTLTIVGLQVRLTNVRLSAACAGSNIKVDLSYNGGTNWSTKIATVGLTTSSQTSILGSASSVAPWGVATWGRNDFSTANFRVRLQASKASCGVTVPEFRADMLEARVYWSMDTATTTTTTTTTNLTDKLLQGPGSACTTGVSDCYEADGTALNPRGFWATMNTEGAENVNGDAFQPYYDDNSGTNAVACSGAGSDQACYDPTNYYNYAVEMPAGTTNGTVYVYDPVFCEVSVSKGTGDRMFGSTAPVSSFFEVYDTMNTLYDNADDTQLGTSGGLFRQIQASDTSMGGSGGSECKYYADATYGDGRDYHDRWYRVITGLNGGANGHVYRIHTTTTDPNNAADQRTTDGESSFALYASASGGTPRIYGLGAMQMFTPLSASGGATFSEFYMAQIDAIHAGKTMEIKLWDPGDTNPLSADIQIEIPTTTGYQATNLTWTAVKGTTNSSAVNCNSSGSGTSITTANPTSQFNGCWLTIDVQIPTTYTAPTPPGETQGGWWKVKYNMSGSGTSNDVTTWKVQIIGNPVHLIVP